MPYTTHSDLKEPKLTQTLWRYMDLAKFLALIQNESLYFPHISAFDTTDPREGFPSVLNYSPELVASTLRSNGTEPDSNQINDLINVFKKSFPLMRNCFYINCWHINDNESDSQWRIYGNNEMSVAIVSDFEKISRAITDSKKIYGSEVIYYDPEKDITSSRNAHHHAIVKRVAFSHEREFRLLYSDLSFMHRKDAPIGVSVSVKLVELIKHVVISPYAPKWFVTIIESTIKDYGFNIPCSKSNLLEPIAF